MWSGGEAFAEVWSAHTGATWAPFGGVQEEGLRVRAVVGAGAYGSGRVAFGDALIGYHRQLGPVTLKVFGGIALADRPSAESTSTRAGMALGAKAVAETWWAATDEAWVSADLSFTLPDVSRRAGDGGRVDYGSRIRLGWRLWPELWPELSVGLEGGAGGFLVPALEHGSTRAGGFLRYEWSGGEVSISGGLMIEGGDDRGPAHPFGTVSVLTRF
jgi:hypothetical protein